MLTGHSRLTGTLQVLGGSFLICLGVWGLQPPPVICASNGSAGRRGTSSAPRAFFLDLATNLANPKALIFFGALFTTVMTASASHGDRTAHVPCSRRRQSCRVRPVLARALSAHDDHRPSCTA
ncbi:MAG: LysE family transporter [Actinomycetes bacterium]